MHHLCSFVRVGTVAMIVAAGAHSIAVAQPLEVALPPQAPQAKAPTKKPEMRLIQLRNVRAGLLAWWLDPAKNMVPIEVANAYKALNTSGQPVPEHLMPQVQDDIYADAKGLISFAPVDVQNALMAYGTEEGILRFEEIVKSLDKTVALVEISTQFLQMSPEDAAGLNIEFPASAENARPEANKSSIGFARGDVQAQVDALIQQGKARLINAPRMTTLNNLTARTNSMSSSPVVLGGKDEAGGFKPIFDSSQDAESGLISIGTAFGLSVTPSVQDDDFISLTIGPYKTLHVVVNTAKDVIPGGSANSYAVNSGSWINPYFTEQLKVKPDSIRVRKSETLFLKNLQGGLSTLKVRSGQTLVLTNINGAEFPHDLPGQENAVSKQAANVILLVTARILRRAE